MLLVSILPASTQTPRHTSTNRSTAKLRRRKQMHRIYVDNGYINTLYRPSTLAEKTHIGPHYAQFILLVRGNAWCSVSVQSDMLALYRCFGHLSNLHESMRDVCSAS